MITTEQKNGILFIRFTSDLVTVSDEPAVMAALNEALATGTRNIAVTVLVGSLSNQRFIAKLLRQCREISLRENANLFFVELGEEMDCIYRSTCALLGIPLFDSEDRIYSETSTNVAA